MTESGLSVVHRIHLNHTQTVYEIANSNQSQGVHFRTVQHLTHQPTGYKLDIKAVFLNNKARHSLLGLQKMKVQSRFSLEHHSFTCQVPPLEESMLVKMAIIGEGTYGLI